MNVGSPSSPPAKFKPRGTCTNIDDVELADGYYAVDKNATGYPDVRGVGDFATLTRVTNRHSNGISMRTDTLCCINPADLVARTWVRMSRQVSGYWYVYAWQSESTPWVQPSLGTGWDGSWLYFTRYRRVEKRVDVEIYAYASGTPAAAIFTMPSGYRPEVEVRVPAMVLDAGFYIVRPLSVKDYSSGGGVEITAVSGEIIYAAFSFLVL